MTSFHTLSLLVLFIASPFAQAQVNNETAAKFTENAMKLRESILFKIEPENLKKIGALQPEAKYPWHQEIVTTVFWIGEGTSPNNPVHNQSSAWDTNWSRNFGGADVPLSQGRRGFIPANFVPRQNPFYIALPYNDVSGGKTKPEAARVIPWFTEAFVKSGQSVLKGRWIAIRRGNRICYAQWEDVGPFRSDHYEYVFGTVRPRPNLNRGAGLDVSPAVRDYLKLNNTDSTDWRFVDFEEVQPGPWTLYGDNNTFVMNRKQREIDFAKRQ